jgi:hypothetical protein
MKIYISSTFQDLREHRSAVDLTLRRMGHDVLGMEQYVAEGTTPLEKCLSDVRSSDAYLVIVGWRYGFVPTHPSLNPQRRSITELEYQAAASAGTSILAFLLDPDAPWPPSAFDALATGGGADILRFRSELGSAHLSGVFRTPDNLASQAAAAVANLGINRQIVDRALEQTSVGPQMEPFVGGSALVDTTVHSIRTMVESAGTVRSMVVDLRQGSTWWSTRLYLLATLLQTLTSVRQLVFSHEDGSFAAMASPAAVRQGLCVAFQPLAEFDAQVRAGASLDIARETDRVVSLWNQTLQGTEASLKVGVRHQLLQRWIGERLVTRCVDVPADTGLTRIHIQQIVESLLPDVPVDWPLPEAQDTVSPPRRNRLMVVERDAFALEIARQWVQAGIPRTPLR